MTTEQLPERQAELEAWLAEVFPPETPGASSPPGEPGHTGTTGLSDDAVVRRCESGANGPKFTRLFWGGDLSDYTDAQGHVDRSGADLALCNLLRFYSGDRAQVERLWGRSALGQRDKWHRADYRARTLDAAMAGDVYDPPLEVDLGPEQANSKTPTRDSNAPRRRSQGLTVDVATAILSRTRFARDAGGALYHYHGGVYRPGGERIVRARVKAVLNASDLLKLWKIRLADEVVEFIAVDAPTLWDRPPLDVVNVANGLLHLPSRTLSPHTPDHLTQVQLPVAYDPAAECPGWEAFLDAVFPADALAAGVPWEIAGDLIQPDRSHQKAILCVGEGGNGKSTYLSGLVAFVGRRNVSGVSLHRLEADRFAAARLVGKLANVCPDLPSTHLVGTSVFKAIVDGEGDAISAERKFRDAFDVVPFCRLVFSANWMPRSADSSHAFFRRWTVLPFSRTFEEGDPRRRRRAELSAELAEPAELSGLLNRALATLPALRQHGFTETPSMQQAWQEFREATDPVSVWLTQRTVGVADAVTPKQELLLTYNADAADAGRPPLTATAFGLAVKRHWPDVTDAQRIVANKLVWCWLGIGLRTTSTPGGAP